MTKQDFLAEFGPLERVPDSGTRDDIAAVVNEARLHRTLPPLLEGQDTTWGWWTTRPKEDESWAQRAQALRLAQELAREAHGADLLLTSEGDCPFRPLVARLKRSVPEGQALGICDQDQAALTALDPRALEPSFETATELEAYRRLVHKLSDRASSVHLWRFDLAEREPLRYLVSPVYLLGFLEQHLVGLWAYEVRT